MPDLYPDPGLVPSTAELAETVREGLFLHGILATPDGEAAIVALSELVKRANGHVPVEALPACQAELDQTRSGLAHQRAMKLEAQAERDEAIKDAEMWAAKFWQAEKERDAALATRPTDLPLDYLKLTAERDRLTAALELARKKRSELSALIDSEDDDGTHVGITRHHRAVLTGYDEALAPFEALNPGDPDATPFDAPGVEEVEKGLFGR